MYVDKPLAGVLAVQTLSRLNRAHPQKHDTFVLDFADNAEAVKAAFQELLPRHHPDRRNRCQQAARSEGRTRRAAGV